MDQHNGVARFSDELAHATSRRSVLKYIGVAMASVTGMLVAGSGAPANASQTFANLAARPTGGVSQSVQSCGIWCEPVDCCPAGCCNGIYLFKCTNQCDGSFWYGCQFPPCSGYCQTNLC